MRVSIYKLVQTRSSSGVSLIQQGGKNKGDYDNDSRIAVANPGDKFRVSKERILLIVPARYCLETRFTSSRRGWKTVLGNEGAEVPRE